MCVSRTDNALGLCKTAGCQTFYQMLHGKFWEDAAQNYTLLGLESLLFPRWMLHFREICYLHLHSKDEELVFIFVK